MLPYTNSYEKIRYDDITVTACRLWHGKKENNDIENIGFIIEHEYPLYQIGHRKLLWNIFLCGKLGRL
jgi:hypothetical protein